MCRVWESTLKGVASVFSFTVVNRTLVEKTVCTRILASDCGMTVRMRSGGVRLQPFQGWENVGAQTQGSARRATLGLCDTIPLGLADLAGLSDAIPVGIGCFPVRRMPKHQALSSLGGGEGEAAASRAGPTLIQQQWGVALGWYAPRLWRSGWILGGLNPGRCPGLV